MDARASAGGGCSRPSWASGGQPQFPRRVLGGLRGADEPRRHTEEGPVCVRTRGVRGIHTTR